jgi:hypothetical protein
MILGVSKSHTKEVEEATEGGSEVTVTKTVLGSAVTVSFSYTFTG